MPNIIDRIKKFFSPSTILENQKAVEEILNQKLEELNNTEKPAAKKSTPKKAPAKKTAAKKK